jgi:hypothetical protein
LPAVLALLLDGKEEVDRSPSPSFAADPFIAAEGINLDWSELEVTGDDTLVDVSHEEKCLQNKSFSVEHFTK